MGQGPSSQHLPWCLSTIPAPTCQGPTSEDLRWKWASSTILLAYGQVAASAKAHILPWVDNILSRMIFYFRYSSWVGAGLLAGTSRALLHPQHSHRAQGSWHPQGGQPPPHSHQALPLAAPSSFSTVLQALGKTPPHSPGDFGGRGYGEADSSSAPGACNQAALPSTHWVPAMPQNLPQAVA
ncbi:hypothetical protein GHT09_014877 [Marmota monax]|uniref:Uncharacterized protein n=1 Tax=Marmota monax TaxID=9995 RepID=A0A834UJT1_MARMO|nr:hypothetical protein GHT09_014877 [Marmota monax]